MAVSHVKTSPTVDWTGTVTLLNSQGSTVTAAATDLLRPVDWNSAHNHFYTVNGNTINSSTASGTDVLWGASGALSLQASGSQIIISAPPVLSFFRNVAGGQLTQMGTAQANSLVSIQPFIIDDPVSVSFFECFASINVASAANNSSGYVDASLSCVLYTRNASTLNSSLSWSQSFTHSYSSNTTGSATGVRQLSATMSAAAVILMPGEYFLAIHVSTNNTATAGANTTALANTFSMIGAPVGGTAAASYGVFGGNTNATLGVLHGQGIISTGATRASIAFSDYTMTGSRGILAAPYFFMANQTWQ